MVLFPHRVLPSNIDKVLTNVQMFYDNMHLPSRDDPLGETIMPLCTTEQTGQTPCDSDIEYDMDDTFPTGIFGLLDPPFAPLSTHLLTISLILIISEMLVEDSVAFKIFLYGIPPVPQHQLCLNQTFLITLHLL